MDTDEVRVKRRGGIIEKFMNFKPVNRMFYQYCVTMIIFALLMFSGFVI